MNELFFVTSTFAAIVGSLAAIFSALCASLAYRLSQKIHNDLSADEKIIFGQPQEPHLANKDHSSCVIVCTLLNKSRRKAFVKSVRAIDEQGEEVPIRWSSRIDELGTPLNPFGLIGLIDSVNLYVRRNDGKDIDYMLLRVLHSFSDSPETVEYNPGADFLS